MLSKKLSTASLLITFLAVSACGGGGGGSSDSAVTDTSSATLVVDGIFSSRVIAADIRREDSKESLPVSGLPLEGTEVTVSRN